MHALEDPEARKSFLPEAPIIEAIPPADQAQAIPPVDQAQAIPQVDQAVEAMVPAKKIMTEEQKQTALYHTALRLLMYDEAVKTALITIEETRKPLKSAIDTKELCKQLAKQLKIKEMTISRYLNHIYKHISVDPLYQKALEGLGTSEDEKIVTTLTAICRHSNICLEIISIAAPSPVSNKHSKVDAKDKEATRLKMESIKSDEKMFQDAVWAVFQRLPNRQDVVTSIDIIKELRFKHGISIPAAIRLIGNVYAHKVPAKSSTAQPNNNI